MVSTSITAYTGVNFDRTNNKFIYYKSNNDLDAYLNTKTKYEMPDSSYQRFNEAIRWDGETVDFNSLQACDYLKIDQVMVSGDQNKHVIWYGFIDDVSYINDGTLVIHWSVDTYHTFIHRMTFYYGNIIRGFVKERGLGFVDGFRKIMHNQEPFPSDGSPITVASEKINFITNQNGVRQGDERLQFLVYTLQPAQVGQGSYGTALGTYSQYEEYIIPFDMVSGITYSVYLGNDNIFTPAKGTIQELTDSLGTDSNFVGTSSLVVDAEAWPYIGLEIDHIDISDGHTLFLKKPSGSGNILNMVSYKDLLIRVGQYQMQNGYPAQSAPLFVETQKALSYPVPVSPIDWVQKLLIKYLGLGDAAKFAVDWDFPYKLLAQQFVRLTLTNGRGSIKEYDILTLTTLLLGTLDEMSIARRGTLGDNAKNYYYLVNWRKDTSNVGFYGPNTLTHDEQSFLVDDAPHDVSVILDSSTMYSKNSDIQNQNARQNALMNQKLSERGLGVSMDNLSRSQNTASENLAQNQQYAQFKNAANGVGSIIGGGMATGGAGAAIGVGTTAASMMGTAIQQQQQLQTFNRSQSTDWENAKANNYQSTLQVKQGYANQMATIKAGYAQSRVQNDQVAHQGTSMYFDYSNDNYGMSAQISLPAKDMLLNAFYNFQRTGYAINLYDAIENYRHVKNLFNFIQATNVGMMGKVPHWVMDFFTSIFANGFTEYENTEDGIQRFYTGRLDGNHFVN